jgi:hypothetical protein
MAMEIPPVVRRYWLPILLITAGFLFQLLVLPRSYPPSHYDGESSLPSPPPPSVIRRPWFARVLRFASLLACCGVLFAVLGIDRSAPVERVVEAYDQLSKEWWVWLIWWPGW